MSDDGTWSDPTIAEQAEQERLTRLDSTAAAPASGPRGIDAPRANGAAAGGEHFATAADFLNAPKFVYEDVAVPGIVGKIRIRGITGAERDYYEASLSTMRNGKEIRDIRDARARLVALAAVNADGSRMFAPEQIRDLGRQPAKMLEPLFDAALRQAGMARGDFEEMTENFPDGLSDDSISA